MLPFIGALAGPIIKGLFGVVDQAVEDKDLANQLKNTLQTKVMGILETEVEAARDIIVAEIKSGSWLAQNWRPMLMCLFGAIIANNYIIHPYIALFWPGKSVSLDIPPDMWDLLKIGIGGYVVGRSVEKGVKVWKDK